MPAMRLFYLSSNYTWGGSEILWLESLKQFGIEGYQVKAGIRYDYSMAGNYFANGEQVTDLRLPDKPVPVPLRLLQKTGLFKFSPRNILIEELWRYKPDLVIISQGNNLDGRPFMKDCVRLNIPFVTITHLVSAGLWPSLNDGLIDELKTLYQSARKNFFVSKNTLQTHDKLLGSHTLNGSIVYNPFVKKIPADFEFPLPENNVYNIALVGRIEIFHKGYDLLIEVLASEKWRKRPVLFSLFGKGPHKQLLQRMLKENDVANFRVYDHIENIAEIWKHHHILIMPSRMEGQSLTLIEAMRFNRAAIVTDVGGTTELIDDGVNGFVARYPLPEYIDEALERAWEKRSEWQQMGIKAGESIAEKHPPNPLSHFNDQIKKILTEL